MSKKKNKDYWKERLKLKEQLQEDEQKVIDRLIETYKKQSAKIERDINNFYASYGENNVIEYRKLLEKLSEADKVLLFEKVDDFALKYPQYKDLVEVRKNIYKLNRLEGLQQSIKMDLFEVGAITNEEMQSHLEKQAIRNANLTAEEMGYGTNFYKVNSDITKQFVNVPWTDGKNFSQRIWENTEKLSNYISTEVAQAIARGDEYKKIERSITDRFLNSTSKNAHRLVFTEGTYVMNESSIKGYEKDYEEYRILSVEDSKVCSICRGMDGKVFKIKERMVGINFPPFHPMCRCTFEIVIPKKIITKKRKRKGDPRFELDIQFFASKKTKEITWQEKEMIRHEFNRYYADWIGLGEKNVPATRSIRNYTYDVFVKDYDNYKILGKHDIIPRNKRGKK